MMTDRLMIAYGLIAAMILVVAAALAYRAYHGRERSYRRRMTRERRDDAARAAARADPTGG